ncbi:MAG: hypothetical protein PHR68_04405 [Candidatus Gracilibacteria bacterium]|nr:hypothetical protein [Candidatus Gracilibacteria bacterium]
MSGKTPSEEVLETLERIKNLAQNNEQIDNQANIIIALAEKNSELLGIIEEQKKYVADVTEELNQDFQLLKGKIITEEDKEKLRKQLMQNGTKHSEKISSLNSEITKLKAEIKSYEALDLKVKSVNITDLQNKLNSYKKSYEDIFSKMEESNKEVKTLNEQIEKLKNDLLNTNKLNSAFSTLNKTTQVISSIVNPEEKQELLRLRKEKQELEDKLAEIEKKERNEEVSIEQLNKQHRNDLKKINTLESENGQLIKIIELLSEDANISLDDLKLFLKIENISRGNKIFTKVENMKKIKTYKDNQNQQYQK